MFGPLLYPSGSSSSAGDDPSSSSVHFDPTEQKFGPCLLCSKVYRFPNDAQDCLSHVFHDHKLVIGDVHQIVNLPEYLRFWKKKLTQENLSEFCSKMKVDVKKSGEVMKDQEYYLLSDVVNDDKEIRKKLQDDKIQSALDQQKRERDDSNYSHGCLFCRQDIGPTREEYLNHLSSQHNVQLGRPANLVYVDKLITIIEEKMENGASLLPDLMQHPRSPSSLEHLASVAICPLIEWRSDIKKLHLPKILEDKLFSNWSKYHIQESTEPELLDLICLEGLDFRERLDKEVYQALWKRISSPARLILDSYPRPLYLAHFTDQILCNISHYSLRPLPFGFPEEEAVEIYLQNYCRNCYLKLLSASEITQCIPAGDEVVRRSKKPYEAFYWLKTVRNLIIRPESEGDVVDFILRDTRLWCSNCLLQSSDRQTSVNMHSIFTSSKYKKYLGEACNAPHYQEFLNLHRAVEYFKEMSRKVSGPLMESGHYASCWLDRATPDTDVIDGPCSNPGMVDYMIWPWMERFGIFEVREGDRFALPKNKLGQLASWMDRMTNDDAAKKNYFTPEKHERFLGLFKSDDVNCFDVVKM